MKMHGIKRNKRDKMDDMVAASLILDTALMLIENRSVL
jgi:RNase H-fold protein (predicted Holliday junction resolvase)